MAGDVGRHISRDQSPTLFHGHTWHNDMTGGLGVNFAKHPLDLESTFQSASEAFALVFPMSNSLPSSCPKAQKAFEGSMPANDARVPEGPGY